ncbi:DUF2958 domain-containing protein [Methyloceanibacter sp.]|uniref:DUF2958 domain-containing protein n=1 Tax=Methyloceanibacter sp. TaxID=1965321 RepID=UPI002D188E0A|nr:DUF2958 domain-containing protein [Methyloceanibacter sp.]HML91926.1 DUF2958 domain-containing protein [Methyloceanibacter sp.]
MGVPEIGSVSIADLESVKGKLGLPVERDFHFAPRHTISVYARAARTEGTITECHAVLDKAAADSAPNVAPTPNPPQLRLQRRTPGSFRANHQ